MILEIVEKIRHKRYDSRRKIRRIESFTKTIQKLRILGKTKYE